MIGFTFYKNFYELIKYLPEDIKAKILISIMEYMFDDKEPVLDGLANGVWINLKLVLDKSKRNIKNGTKGGRPKKEEQQEKTQTETQTETQMNFKKKANNISYFLFYISNLNINNNIKDILNKWLEYKQDIKDMYKSQKSIETLVKKFIKECEEHGIEKVNDLVDEAIANGYKGVVWDKLRAYNTSKQQDEIPLIRIGEGAFKLGK